MKDQDVLEIIPQILAFVWSENPQRKANQGPQVYNGVIAAVVFTQFVNLGMTVVTTRNTVVGTGGLDLIVFQFAIGQALFLEARLEKTTATAATVIIGSIGCHIDEIFFSHYRLHHVTQIFGNGISVAFADNLTGILNREFDFEILVPVGIDFQFSLPNPFGVIFVNIFNDKVMFDVEFFQSCQD
jgi:hypothetical protein